ncbi:MAG: S8 family serine peptidase [Deltaproteobacteria bacterium]|nr:S8 family serine peptidase [Deltaproteobacteria bacterium]
MNSVPRLWWAAACLLPVVTLLLPLPADARRAVVERGVARELARGIPSEGLRVIVKLRGDGLPAWGPLRRSGIGGRQDRVLARLARGSYKLRHRYTDVPGMAMRLSPRAIRALEAHPDVEYIYLDGRVQAQLAEGRDLVGGTITTLQGFTGSGVRVAVLDTGIDTDHPFLSDDLVTERCWCSGGGGCCPFPPANSSVQSGPGSAEDDEGHGTSVSGIITSSDPLSTGLAPDAEIVALKVLDDGGGGNFSDIDLALQWVVSNHATYNIRAVNMSLSDGEEHDNAAAWPCDPATTTTGGYIQSLAAAGVAVFVASGNQAHNNGVGFPACVTAAIAVGGVYDEDFGPKNFSPCSDPVTGPDLMVCHTNTGSLLEVMAPDYLTRTTDVGGASTVFWGTSAASPYAAAAAALMFARDPSLTVAGLRGMIASHGPLVADPDNPPDAFPRIAPAHMLTTLVFGTDTDSDGIADDGDGSGSATDDFCTGGDTLLCDDNCLLADDPNQVDTGGIGLASAPDGIGTACQCGDLDSDGEVAPPDVDAIRASLADPSGAALSSDAQARCTVQSGATTCGLVEAAILLRNLNSPPFGPAIEPVCDDALGS